VTAFFQILCSWKSFANQESFYISVEVLRIMQLVLGRNILSILCQ